LVTKQKAHSGINSTQNAAFFEKFLFTKRKAHSGKNSAAECCKNSVTKQKALSAPKFVPERRTFYVLSKCVAFHAVIAVFRSVTAAHYTKSEAGFTVEYRMFKKL